jgi:hypothetical protein
MQKLISFFIAFFAFCSVAFTQNGLKTKSISVFKDGTSFVIKQGIVKTTNGVFQIAQEQFPQAKFGSFWIYSPDLQNVMSYTDTLRGDNSFNSVTAQELIKPNKGKKVQLKYSMDSSLIEGTIEDILSQTADNSGIGNALLFQTKDGKWLTIPLSQVERVVFSEKPALVYKIPYKKPVQVLEIAFNSKKMEQNLETMYLQHGISWTSFYLLELQNDNDAKLTLRAEVVNQNEAIENTDLNFVVGVPNFKFVNSLSSLINFVQATPIYSNQRIEMNNFSQQFSNSYSAQEFVQNDATVVTNPTFDNQLEGQSVGDLYFYPLKNFSLPKNGRGHYQLFSHDINYENVYECNLEPSREPSYYYNNTVDYNFTQQNKNKVFHSLKIKNKTTNPFTTGSVMIVSHKQSRNQPLGQDILNFTSKNATTYIKVTESADIKARQSEKVTERSTEDHNFYGNLYYKLKVEGKVTLNNYKGQKVKFELRRAINGVLGESDLKWQIGEQNTMEYNPNLLNQVCWEFELEAGAEKTFTYRYEVYVRR